MNSGPRIALKVVLRRVAVRLAACADRISFENLADDIRWRVPSDYSVYVNTNQQRIVIIRNEPNS